MALTKQNLNINFSQGVDTKTDPWQVSAGKFLSFQNSVFTKGGLFSKRNGFGALSTLASSTSSTLCTYNGDLLAVSQTLQSLSQDTNQWMNKGVFQPCSLSVISAVRTATSQTTVDTAIASNGLACSVWVDSNTNCYYRINDSSTGQIIVNVTQLTAASITPRVFVMGRYFIVTYALAGVLKYVAIPYSNPSVPFAPADITTLFSVSGTSAGYDGVVANNNLYIVFDANDVGNAVRVTYLDSTLLVHVVKLVSTGLQATLVSVTADLSQPSPIIWLTYWNQGGGNAYSAAYSATLTVILAPTLIFTRTINALTSTAVNSVCSVYFEVATLYPYVSVRSDVVNKVSITIAGVVGSIAVILRSVGLASKAVYVTGSSKAYLLVVYAGALQPTYFLIDDSGNTIAKLAYSNGGGYVTTQILPQINVIDGDLVVGYLIKDLLVPVNKAQGGTSSPTFSQLGINIATFSFSSKIVSPEIGLNLHLTGGFLWMYDGAKPVEHNFHVWPEDILVATSGAGGAITAQLYYYYATYEWTDTQGNLHRSAPSIPFAITTAGATSSNTINIPTLRITSKISPNPVRIVIYRWSTAQQVPYQVTSITSPILNNTTTDRVTYVDTLPDSSILGGVILYTFGGVVENIAAPACDTATLFKNRLIVLDSEDKNLLWFSKQVIETTPVEMSSLLTQYVAPTISAQGSTGPIQCLSAMDDKLIIFKNDAIYYMTGNGPDITGNNNDFSEPVFITSTVGCSNQSSIVFMPQGLMFQSDKGIWVLQRDLQTTYVGAPVEAYNNAIVLSAVNVPATNQVRFTLDNGLTLMYDYFFGQWGTFVNVPAVSSTIYQSAHTYLNSSGQVFQETPGAYIDGSNPVLMSFTTSWLNLAGLQGYERSYFFFLLGKYYSPHKLNVQVAYDYNENFSQSNLITPTNMNSTYGSDALYGSSSPFGGGTSVEQWRIFFEQGKCQAFQITVTEVFDSSYGVAPGAGLTLSGINVVVGAKSTYPRLPAKNYAN